MPGPRPYYQPEFSAQQIKECQATITKRNLPHAIVERARLALILREDRAISNPAAVKLLGHHENWVRYWRKRWATEGFGLRDKGASPFFPLKQMTVLKAIACERPEKRNHQPLSRYSLADIRDIAVHQESFETISVSTVWRILAKDAIRPWRYRYWIFPRDPLFFEKAEPILGLYEGIWQGRPLSKWMFVLSADEKTSIQGRYRCPAAKAPAPGQLSLFEHGYQRLGALQYLTAWDVHRGKVFGHCEARTGKVSFRRLVEQLMSQEPYRSADQIFGIVDNSSSHRGPQAAKELNELYPNATLLHLPVHASWLNQIEMYFGIVQRKVLTPNEFKSLPEIAYRLSAFEKMINAKSKPFGWKFTRQDLQRRLKEFKLAA